MTKRCSRCKVEKPLDEFARSKARAHLDGRGNYCKQCAREKAAEWTAANRELVNSAQRRRRASDPDRYRAYEGTRTVPAGERSRRFRAVNPEYMRAANHVRRALVRGARSVPFTVEQLEARLAYYGFRCWQCGAPWEHLDHVKPLSKGGPHMLSNLRPACAGCNLKKGSHWPVDTSNRRGHRDSSDEVHQSRA